MWYTGIHVEFDHLRVNQQQPHIIGTGLCENTGNDRVDADAIMFNRISNKCMILTMNFNVHGRRCNATKRNDFAPLVALRAISEFLIRKRACPTPSVPLSSSILTIRG